MIVARSSSVYALKRAVSVGVVVGIEDGAVTGVAAAADGGTAVLADVAVAPPQPVSEAAAAIKNAIDARVRVM
jgi:hypothetical protein